MIHSDGLVNTVCTTSSIIFLSIEEVIKRPTFFSVLVCNAMLHEILAQYLYIFGDFFIDDLYRFVAIDFTSLN